MITIKPIEIERSQFWLEWDDEKDEYYWVGFCSGDKEGHRYENGEPLILECSPEHFKVGCRISEIIKLCPECHTEASFIDSKWYCEFCDND